MCLQRPQIHVRQDNNARGLDAGIDLGGDDDDGNDDGHAVSPSPPLLTQPSLTASRGGRGGRGRRRGRSGARNGRGGSVGRGSGWAQEQCPQVKPLLRSCVPLSSARLRFYIYARGLLVPLCDDVFCVAAGRYSIACGCSSRARSGLASGAQGNRNTDLGAARGENRESGAKRSADRDDTEGAAGANGR